LICELCEDDEEGEERDWLSDGDARRAKYDAKAQYVYPPCASPRGGELVGKGCDADAIPPSYVWQL
jgi:hypothetical protein